MDYLANHIASGIVVVDEELVIIGWNRWIALHTNISQQDAINKNLADLFSYIDVATLKRRIKTTIMLKTTTFYTPQIGYLIKIPKEKLFNQTFDCMRQNIKIIPHEKNTLAIIIINDHTEIEEAYKKVDILKERAMHYVRIMDKYVNTIITDAAGIIINVSPAMCELTGYSCDELIGQKTSIIRHPETSDDLYQNLWASIKQGHVWQGELKNMKKNGEVFYVKSSIFPIETFTGEINYQGVLEDVTDKKIIERLTITDELTKLYNRRYFNESFMRELSLAKRHEKIFVFYMIDVDFFKQYNDEYGHKMGDDTLIAIATSIKNVLKRSSDLAFRLGGEEFGVIACVSDRKDAIHLGELIRIAIQDLNIIHIKNHHKVVTASVGICATNAKTVDLSQENLQETIYAKADVALYKAKEYGRNKVIVSD